MVQKEDIPYLIQLIDDDSEEVREHVHEELVKLGRLGEQWVKPYWRELTGKKQQILQELFKESRWDVFFQGWGDWMIIDDDRLALEMALAELAFLDMGVYSPPLEDLLDQLYEQMVTSECELSIDGLMNFLFVEEKYKSPGNDYYNPLNSNMVYVIQHKKGLQISLSCLAVMLARRLNLPLYGLNVPGHFMMLAESQREVAIIDPYRKGKVIARISKLMQPRDIRRANTPEVVTRILRNIINAYQKQKDEFQAKRYSELLQSLVDRN